jgi:hypothetical protein
MLIGLNLLTRTLYFALPNGQGFFRFYAEDAVENLANDFGNVAMAAIFNKSEYDDGSDRQDSTRNQRADFASLAAIKRSVMLKDFLKLADYKIKR